MVPSRARIIGRTERRHEPNRAARWLCGGVFLAFAEKYAPAVPGLGNYVGAISEFGKIVQGALTLFKA